jgi:hypothetical protein
MIDDRVLQDIIWAAIGINITLMQNDDPVRILCCEIKIVEHRTDTPALSNNKVASRCQCRLLVPKIEACRGFIQQQRGL